MKKLIFALFIFAAISAKGQVVNPGTGGGGVVLVSSAPSGACSAGVAGQLVTSTGVIYTCQSGTWASVSGSAGSTTYDLVGSGTDLNHGLVNGNGNVLTYAGTGVVNSNELYGVLLSGLGTGIYKFTAGVPSIAVAADFPTLNQSTTGNAATATNISTNGTGNQVWGMNSGATAQGWQTISAGGGNTTSTSLTTNCLPKANGANSIINSSVCDDGTTVSTPEVVSALSYTTSGATPGAQSLVAGTGNIPTLTANSAGFAAPVTGGTAWLGKLPATINAGLLHFAAPTTADGVNESAITSSLVAIADLSASGTPSSTTFLRGDNTWAVPSGSISGLTTNFIPKAASSTTITNSALDDGATTANTLTYTGSAGVVAPAYRANGTTAGFLELTQGTANTAGTTSIKFQAPTSVTSQLRTLTGTPATGYPFYTNTAGSMVETLITPTGTGATVQATSPTLVTPTLGAATATSVTSGLYSASGTAPTMAAGAAAGTSPTCTTITGHNQAGVITCTTGIATATGTLATITFNGTLTTAPQGCQLYPRNSLTALTTTSIFTTAPSTTTWTIGIATALTISTAYSWSYICL